MKECSIIFLMILFSSSLSYSDYSFVNLGNESYSSSSEYPNGNTISKISYSQVINTNNDQTNQISTTQNEYTNVQLDISYNELKEIGFEFEGRNTKNYVQYTYIANNTFPNTNINKNANINQSVFDNNELIEKTLKSNSDFDNLSNVKCNYFQSPSLNQQYLKINYLSIVHGKYFNYGLDKSTNKIMIFQLDNEAHLLNSKSIEIFYRSYYGSLSYTQLFLSYSSDWNELYYFLIAYSISRPNEIVLFKVFEYSSDNITISEARPLSLTEYLTTINQITYSNELMVICAENGMFVYNFDRYSMYIYWNGDSGMYPELSNNCKDISLSNNKVYGLSTFSFGIGNTGGGMIDWKNPFQTGRRNNKLNSIKNLNNVIKIQILCEYDLIEFIIVDNAVIQYNKIIHFPNMLSRSYIGNYNDLYSFVFGGNDYVYIFQNNVPNSIYTDSYKLQLKSNTQSNPSLYTVVLTNQKQYVLIRGDIISLIITQISPSSSLFCKFTKTGEYKLSYPTYKDCSTYSNSCSPSEVCEMMSYKVCQTNNVLLFTVNQNTKYDGENNYKGYIIATFSLQIVIIVCIIVFVLYYFLYAKNQKNHHKRNESEKLELNIQNDVINSDFQHRIALGNEKAAETALP